MEWCIGVYCANEAETIEKCLWSIAENVLARKSLICVIVNGSVDSSADIAQKFAEKSQIPVKIYYIAFGDKSNAINQFFYKMSNSEKYVFGIDAHCYLAAGSLSALSDYLDAHPDTLGVTGVAANGRTNPEATRQAVKTGGQFNGQLYAIRSSFINRLVAANIRLPVNLYRGDGLLGSMLAHNLDATGHEWRSLNLMTVEGAKYFIRSLSLFSISDLHRQYRRKLRQLRGVIENQSIKKIIYNSNYAALPFDSDAMILDYVEQHGMPKFNLVDRILSIVMLGGVSRQGTPRGPSLEPVLVFANDAALALDEAARA